MSVRRWAGEAWRKPATLVVIAALVAAFAFSNVAGTLGELVLAGAAGLGVWHIRQRYSGRWNITPRAAGWIAIGVVTLVSLIVFRPVMLHPSRWPRWDWACHDAVISDALQSLRHGHLPHWNHLVVGGDSSLELYPAFTNVLAGTITILSGADDNLPVVLLLMGVAVHTLISINATRLALRFLPAPIAAVIGCALLLDQGGISSGGVVGTLEFGLLHSALGQVFSLCALVCVVDCIQRPRLRTTIGVWVFSALAVITHPSALLAAAVVILGLLMVALLARDVPARRSLFAAAHVVVGVALGAFVWLPFGERLIQYAQHFSNILVEPGQWLVDTFARAIPEGSFAILVFLAYAGIVAGLWSRRAVPVLVSSIALALLVARSDLPYLAFDLAPSQTVARLGADRFYGLVRPFSYVLGAYAITLGYRQIRATLPPLSPRSVRIACVVAGVLGAGALRISAQASLWLIDQARTTANHRVSKDITEPLVGWEYTRMLEQSPERYGRTLFYGVSADVLHATARSGLPNIFLGPLPDVLIRERVEDDSAESLRRYNVRWLIYFEPDALNQATPDVRLGPWRIHDVPEWDGVFARVEKGPGTAITHQIDNDVVEVELTGTDKAALVALGMNYYPRWRAVDAAGHALPVYAYPTKADGKLDVVAAWLPPGVTRFYPDGPLPSDGDGRGLSLVALLVALSAIIVWSRRTWRFRALALLSRSIRAASTRVPLAVRVGSIVFALGILGLGLARDRGAVTHLELGTGALGGAEVSVRLHDGSAWKPCSYSTMFGQYQCDEAVITDSTWAILNDEQPMWEFTTPTIYARPRKSRSFDVRIRMRRHLAGTYWAGSDSSDTTIEIEGMPAVTVHKQVELRIEDKGERDITITALVSTVGQQMTFVEKSTLIPDRALPRAPSTP